MAYLTPRENKPLTDPGVHSVITTTHIEMYKKGYDDGHDIGIKRSQDRAYQQGHDDGYEEGWTDGKRQGYLYGYLTGISAGALTLLSGYAMLLWSRKSIKTAHH